MNFAVVLDSESRNVLEIPWLMISQAGPVGPFLTRYDTFVVQWGPKMVRIVLWYDKSVLWVAGFGRALVQWSSGMILPALARPQ
jgi:hypothetical protein